MEIKIELKNVEPRPIASIFEKVKARQIPRLFPKLIMEVIGFLENNKIKPFGAPLAIFYNWDKGKGEMEVGMPIAEPIIPEGRISASEIPGGKVVYVLYIGNLRKIKTIYDKMQGWIKDNNYSYSNIWWEVYLTDPRVEPDQNKWQTEVNLLLE